MTRFIPLASLFFATTAFAQPTLLYSDPQRTPLDADDRYRERVFGASHQLTSQYLATQPSILVNNAQNNRDNAELTQAKAAVRLNMYEGEKLMTDFIRNHEPDPIAMQARTEIGAYYFDKGDYANALKFFESAADNDNLNNADLADLKFKTGYAYFARKKYSQAKPYFKEIRNNEKSPNYAQANYYYGLIAFFERNYDEALSSFRISEKSKLYAATVPFSICQLLFVQKKYDDLIKYATPLASDTKLKNLTEIQQLIGQAYFEKGDFKAALPYLEKYVTTTSKLTEKDFYQVGYTQYRTGAYKEATQNFEQLHTQKNELGQNALYHLGDCYLKTNNLVNARNAFKECSAMSYNPTIQQTALFNYAKLSYLLGNDQQTLNTLKTVPENSPYFAEAQDLMADVLDKMSDYQSAINFIGKLPNPTA